MRQRPAGVRRTLSRPRCCRDSPPPSTAVRAPAGRTEHALVRQTLAAILPLRRSPRMPDEKLYHVRATNPATNEQIAFECVGLAVANAKAAELRMAAYKDVIMSLAEQADGSGQGGDSGSMDR
jgi:hypothetical protein